MFSSYSVEYSLGEGYKFIKMTINAKSDNHATKQLIDKVTKDFRNGGQATMKLKTEYPGTNLGEYLTVRKVKGEVKYETDTMEVITDEDWSDWGASMMLTPM